MKPHSLGHSIIGGKVYVRVTGPVNTAWRLVRFPCGTSRNTTTVPGQMLKITRGLVLVMTIIMSSKWSKLDVSLAPSLHTQRRHSHRFDKKHTVTAQYPRAIQNRGQLLHTHTRYNFPSMSSPTRKHTSFGLDLSSVAKFSFNLSRYQRSQQGRDNFSQATTSLTRRRQRTLRLWLKANGAHVSFLFSPSSSLSSQHKAT